MGYTGPYHRLVMQRPLGTLAGVHVMLSLALHTILLIIFQISALKYLQNQSWFVTLVITMVILLLWLHRYEPIQPDVNSGNILSSENTVLFQFSIFQYVSLAVAMSTAAPYRKPLYTNSKRLEMVNTHTHTHSLSLSLSLSDDSVVLVGIINSTTTQCVLNISTK